MAITLIDFWATWCPPCKMMNPVVEELEKEMAGKVTFVKYDVDQNSEIAQKYGIMSIPTYVIEKDGKEVVRASGAKPKEEFKKWIEENI